MTKSTKYTDGRYVVEIIEVPPGRGGFTLGGWGFRGGWNDDSFFPTKRDAQATLRDYGFKRVK